MDTVASMKRYGFGLLGCGNIARGHMAAYGNWFKLVACCDVYEPAAREYKERYGFARYYTDYRHFFEDPDIELVTVCTSSTHERLDIVRKGAECGKQMLVEKPLAIEWPEALEMVNIAQAHRIKLAVSQQYRNYPHLAAAREILASGVLGQPFLGSLQMAHLAYFPMKGCKRDDYFLKHPKVVILNMTVHHFDTLRYWLDEDPVEIYTRAGIPNFRTQLGEAGDTWSVSTIVFPRGCTFQVFSSADCRGGQPVWEGRTHIECENGSLYINDHGDDIVAAYVADQDRWIVPKLPPRNQFGTLAWQKTMRDMIRWIEEGVEHPTSARDNLKTMRMVFRAYDSAETGVPVAVSL